MCFDDTHQDRAGFCKGVLNSHVNKYKENRINYQEGDISMTDWENSPRAPCDPGQPKELFLWELWRHGCSVDPKEEEIPALTNVWQKKQHPAYNTTPREWAGSLQPAQSQGQCAQMPNMEL